MARKKRTLEDNTHGYSIPLVQGKVDESFYQRMFLIYLQYLGSILALFLKFSLKKAVVTAGLLLWGLFSLAEISSFIYVNF